MEVKQQQKIVQVDIVQVAVQPHQVLRHIFHLLPHHHPPHQHHQHLQVDV